MAFYTFATLLGMLAMSDFIVGLQFGTGYLGGF